MGSAGAGQKQVTASIAKQGRRFLDWPDECQCHLNTEQ